MHENDAPVTRDEMNRLLADLRALQMLVTDDIGDRWGKDQAAAWYERRARQFDDNAGEVAEDVIANFQRALAKLATMVRQAAGRPRPGHKPPTQPCPTRLRDCRSALSEMARTPVQPVDNHAIVTHAI